MQITRRRYRYLCCHLHNLVKTAQLKSNDVKTFNVTLKLIRLFMHADFFVPCFSENQDIQQTQHSNILKNAADLIPQKLGEQNTFNIPVKKLGDIIYLPQ